MTATAWSTPGEVDRRHPRLSQQRRVVVAPRGAHRRLGRRPRLSAHERERYAEFDYQSEICVPLVVDGQTIGFLDIFDTRPRDFVEFADFLQGFSPVLARATQNAVLLRELEHRNAALRDLVQLGELVAQVSDVGELLRLAALRLFVTLDAASCDVYSVDGEELVQLVSVGPDGFNDDDNGWRAPLSHYPGFATALARGEPWVIGSPDDPRLSDYEIDWYQRWGLKSTLSIPLVVNGEGPRRDRHRRHARTRLRRASRLHAQRRPAPLQRLREGGCCRAVWRTATVSFAQLVDAGLEFGASLEMDDVLRSVAGHACAVAGRGDLLRHLLLPRATSRLGPRQHRGRTTRPTRSSPAATYRIDDMHITRLRQG